MEKKYKRLSLEERVKIEAFLEVNKSKSFIAKSLNRSRSSINNEIKKWVLKPGDIYNASLAHWYSLEENQNKRTLDKIDQYPKLKMFVYRSLLKGTSPELMTGQLKILYPNDPVMAISHESVYKHIYKHRQSTLAKKLIKLLPYHHHKRRDKRKFNKNRVRIKDQISIENRLEAGHLE